MKKTKHEYKNFPIIHKNKNKQNVSKDLVTWQLPKQKTDGCTI